MADNLYLTMRVSESLLRAGGDRKLAQRLLLDEAARDHRLLTAMVTPFLPNIANRIVQRTCERTQSTDHRPNRPAEPVRRSRRGGLSATDLDTIVGQLGNRIGATPMPGGLDALLYPQAQPKASPRHEDSIRQIAVAFARKRLDETA